MDPSMTELWDPEVKVIHPGGSATAPPSDALVLFDGKDVSQWKGIDGGPVKWIVKDGTMTVVTGANDITTKREFGDFQLHVEWAAPVEVVGERQVRGNSGIYLQDRYELQVLDSYNNRTYSNGQAGSIYKQTPPLVNNMSKPGEWNIYEVIYTAPRFNDNGSLFTPAYVTVIHNGAIVQNHTAIKGSTEYIGLPVYKAHGKAPLRLQDHHSPVRYRNIWIRDL